MSTPTPADHDAAKRAADLAHLTVAPWQLEHIAAAIADARPDNLTGAYEIGYRMGRADALRAPIDLHFRDQIVEALDDTATGIYMGKGWGATIADALAPVIAQVRTAGRIEGHAAALEPFAALFAGDPVTPCRTTWRFEPGWSLPGSTVQPAECVEVPIDELRAAFGEAERALRGGA